MKLMFREFNIPRYLYIIVALFNTGCSSGLKMPYNKYYAIGGSKSTIILDENNTFSMYINEGLVQLQLYGDVSFNHEKKEIYLLRKDVIKPHYVYNEEIDDSAEIRIKFYSQSFYPYPLFSDPILIPLDYSFFDQIIGIEGVEIISKNEFILKKGFLEIEKSGFKLGLNYDDLNTRGIKEVQILVSEANLFIREREFKGIINKNGFDIYMENGTIYKYRKRWRRTRAYIEASK